MPDKDKSKAPSLKERYLKELTQRGKESHVYRKYQLIGLEISQILKDERHKALYIKLAKEGGADRMLRLAKDVATRDSVKNKGAYFMSILKGEADLRLKAVTAQEKAESKEARTKKRNASPARSTTIKRRTSTPKARSARNKEIGQDTIQ